MLGKKPDNNVFAFTRQNVRVLMRLQKQKENNSIKEQNVKVRKTSSHQLTGAFKTAQQADTFAL